MFALIIALIVLLVLAATWLTWIITTPHSGCAECEKEAAANRYAAGLRQEIGEKEPQ